MRIRDLIVLKGFLILKAFNKDCVNNVGSYYKNEGLIDLNGFSCF